MCINTSTKPVLTVAVCTVTGNQGREIAQRFHKMNQAASAGNQKYHVRGLTRDKTSKRAAKLVEKTGPQTLSLVDVDYWSKESLRAALKGADALYINSTMSKDEAKQYEQIIDVAVDEVGIQHLIYSSTVECQKDHGVPHWETSQHTEMYLQQKYQECKGTAKQFGYHLVRFSNCNENMLTYFAPKNGYMAFPYDPSVGGHTASVKDGARVACRLFAQPNSLPMDGTGIVNVATEYRTANDWAAAVTKAKAGETDCFGKAKKPIRAYKGPWIFVKFGHNFGWEPSSILTMGAYLEKYWSESYISTGTSIHEYLKEEIQAGEPLETIEEFATRHFG
jgi:NmrA-like family